MNHDIKESDKIKIFQDYFQSLSLEKKVEVMNLSYEKLRESGIDFDNSKKPIDHGIPKGML
jgi:hypothetical protein